jgi:LEA14-like dessication related protein
MHLRELAVTGLSAEGGSVLLFLDVYNPNRYEIRAARFHVAIEIEGVHFGDALLQRPLRLEARARTPVQLPLTFTWAGVGAAARGILSRGSVVYDLAGRMLVNTPAGQRDVGLSRRGSVSLRNVMR